MKRYIVSIVAFLVTAVQLTADDFDVTVSASENSSALLSAIGYDNLGKVTNLKVSGTLNGYDYMALRNKLPNLVNLDLSGTTIKENENEYYYYQSLTVKSTEFPAYLFYESGITDKLVSVKLPQNVESIGEQAFRSCSKLTSVAFNSNVRNINAYAFAGCSTLPSIQLPLTVETVGNDAFSSCSSLKSVAFPLVLYSIARNAFVNCRSLEKVEFFGELNSIGDYAFSGCTKLQSVSFNNRLSTIGLGSFGGCELLTQLTLPSSLSKIGSKAFERCKKISLVNAYAVQPVAIEQNTFDSEIFNQCQLNVPRAGYSAYYWDTKWSQFSSISPCDFTYQNLYITNTGEDYILDESTGAFHGTPEITVLAEAGIIIKDDIDQKSSELILMTDGTNAGSVIASNNLTATYFTMQLQAKKNVWYYFCLPFDAPISTGVRCHGNWVIRTYSGQQRADTGSGWTALPAGETKLKAHVGYIFQTDTDGPLFITMSNPAFSDQDQSLRIELSNSANLADASWNFLGNPFPAYYCLKDLDFSGPVTVRNVKSNTYISYNGTDDTYHLAPFQPFFVQKPTSANLLRFQAGKRRTYVMSQNKSYLSVPRNGGEGESDPNSIDRKVIDLALLDAEGDLADRTRVVFNESMTYGYDLGADAAKFFSNEATLELYTITGSTSFGINERPQSGDIQVAYRALEAGTYRLSLKRADVAVELYDALTGNMIDLRAGDYSFETEAGTFTDRFVLAASSSAIEQIGEESGEAVRNPSGGYCYDLTGRRVTAPAMPGIYVTTKKMMR